MSGREGDLGGMSGDPLEDTPEMRFGLGEFESEDDCAQDSVADSLPVTLSLGGTYNAFRRFLGINSSSSDHSASASANGFSIGSACGIEESRRSAEGQDSFRALMVESRTSYRSLVPVESRVYVFFLLK